MPIFLDDLDYARLLEMMAEVVRDFEIDSWVVCAMPNHTHWVLRTRRPNLSLAIGHLNGCYAQWWNKRHGHIGHVYQGRFKGQIVEASVYLVRLVRYVLMNPVRAGLCSHPRDWPWSSYGNLVSGVPCPHVDIASLLALVDTDVTNARKRLVEYASPDADPEMAAFIRGDQRVIGTPAFAEQFRTQARTASKEVPARERRVGGPSLVEILADAVRAGEGLPGGIRRAHTEARYPATEIARCAGLSRMTVQRIIEGRSGPRSSPGTQRRANTDLTPAVDANADLAPERGGTQT
jgi:REP element-mobilizing transposase RayT